VISWPCSRENRGWIRWSTVCSTILWAAASTFLMSHRFNRSSNPLPSKMPVSKCLLSRLSIFALCAGYASYKVIPFPVCLATCSQARSRLNLFRNHTAQERTYKGRGVTSPFSARHTGLESYSHGDLRCLFSINTRSIHFIYTVRRPKRLPDTISHMKTHIIV
jgi:hypothetical protein